MNDRTGKTMFRIRHPQACCSQRHCWRSPARRRSAVKPFTADYSANYMGLQGNGTMTLAPAGGDRWTYTLNIRSASRS